MDQQDILNNLGKDEKVLIGLMDKYQGKIPKGTIELKDVDEQKQKRGQEPKKKCPNCKANIPVESKKCPECGHTKSFEGYANAIKIDKFKDKIRSKFGKAKRGIVVDRGLYEVTQTDFADGGEMTRLLNHNFNFMDLKDGRIREVKGDTKRVIYLKDGDKIQADGNKTFVIHNNKLFWSTKTKDYSVPVEKIEKIKVYNYSEAQSTNLQLDMFARKKKQKPDKSKPVHPRAGKKICPACHKVTVFYQDGDLMRCDRCKKTFRRKRL